MGIGDLSNNDLSLVTVINLLMLSVSFGPKLIILSGTYLIWFLVKGNIFQNFRLILLALFIEIRKECIFAHKNDVYHLPFPNFKVLFYRRINNTSQSLNAFFLAFKLCFLNWLFKMADNKEGGFS
jgi:hypothetical protein